MSYDHILFIGFGGPTRPEEVRYFLEEVTRGIPIPAERLAEVEHHYKAIGGSSPYNRHSFGLIEKVKEEFVKKSINVPVFLGMRNWHPFLKQTLSEIKEMNLRKGIAIILAPHRSDASFDKYVRSLEEAKQKAGAADIQYEFLPAWHDHTGFIEAQADEVRKVLTPGAHLLFSAHSIPVEMAQKSRYAEEIETSSRLVAESLGHSNWSIAYQSRSGSPRQPWLEPDVLCVIRGLKSPEISTVILVPIGFLCDNAEVLYDLDIEAKAEAEKSGLEYRRASTVMDHPKFTAMFADLIPCASW